MKPLALIRLVFVLACCFVQLAGLSRRAWAAAGDVDVSFDPGSGVNNQVRLIAPLPGGKSLIVGEFIAVRGLRRIGIARINPDGAGDPTFDAGNAGVGRYFTSLAVRPDGTVLLGAEDGLVRLEPDGGGETLVQIPTYEKICYSWGCAYGINAVAVQPDGRILIGGYFMTRQGDTTNYGIARLFPDGTIDSGFNASVAAPVDGAPTSDGVSAIESLPDGKVMVAGFFSRINGVERRGIARLHPDGRLDESFNANVAIGGSIGKAKTQADGKVLVSGIEVTHGGTPPVLARLNADGSLDTAFQFNREWLDSPTHFVPQLDGTILVAGFVNTFHWEGRRLIRLLPNGSLDQTFDAPATGGVLASIKALAVQSDGMIVIGGEISAPGELRRNGLARLHSDGGLDQSFQADTGLTGIRSPGVRSVAVQADGKVLVGGSWVRVAGPSDFGIARLHPDGTPDTEFSPPDSMNVAALVIQPDGKILIGEDLTWLENPGRPLVSRLLPHGEPDISFTADLNELPLEVDCRPEVVANNGRCAESFAVTAVAMHTGGRILIGGFRTTVICYAQGCATIHRHFVARLHPDGRFDDTFQVSQFGMMEGSFVRSLSVQANGRVLVAGPGTFRLNPDGTADESFTFTLPEPGETVVATALALQSDGRILSAMDILDAQGNLRHEMSRFHPDGGLDVSFGTGDGVDGSIYGILVQPGGRLVIAGDFTRVGGRDHHRVARLHPDGNVDDSFSVGGGADGTVYAMAAMGDNGVLIGGGFNTIDGLARPGVAKLDAPSGSGSSFGSWVARFGLIGPNADGEADPDGDGLPNAAEFVLGGIPAIPDPWNQPVVTAGAGGMFLTFPREDASEFSDVRLTVEVSSDLSFWTETSTIGADTAASSPGVSIAENGSNPDTVTISILVAPDQSRFARLKVAVSP